MRETVNEDDKNFQVIMSLKNTLVIIMSHSIQQPKKNFFIKNFEDSLFTALIVLLKSF